MVIIAQYLLEIIGHFLLALLFLVVVGVLAFSWVHFCDRFIEPAITRLVSWVLRLRK